jgi:outer membrane protein assembly factor BamB
MEWQEQLGRVKFHASAVLAEGRVYFTSDDGITYVVKASDEYELLAKNALGEKVFASPAFSDGDIFIRGAKHLWCIGGKLK